jgi:hypothetical protein
MREPYIKLIDELLQIAPDVVVSIEGHGVGAWIVVELPGSQVWWELECRSPESIGLHIHEPNDPEDVPFAPPNEHFTSVESVLTRMSELFQRTPA